MSVARHPRPPRTPPAIARRLCAMALPCVLGVALAACDDDHAAEEDLTLVTDAATNGADAPGADSAAADVADTVAVADAVAPCTTCSSPYFPLIVAVEDAGSYALVRFDDLDGDGVVTDPSEASVFTTWPTERRLTDIVVAGDGTVFVAEGSARIRRLRDTDGDRVADDELTWQLSLCDQCLGIVALALTDDDGLLVATRNLGSGLAIGRLNRALEAWAPLWSEGAPREFGDGGQRMVATSTHEVLVGDVERGTVYRIDLDADGLHNVYRPDAQLFEGGPLYYPHRVEGLDAHPTHGIVTSAWDGFRFEDLDGNDFIEGYEVGVQVFGGSCAGVVDGGVHVRADHFVWMESCPGNGLVQAKPIDALPGEDVRALVAELDPAPVERTQVVRVALAREE